MLINKLLKIINKTSTISISEQKKYIDSMPEPQDDYDRVYFNYKCNSKTKNIYSNYFLDLIGILLIPLFLFVYIVNYIKIKTNIICHQDTEICDALIISAGNRAGKSYSINGIIPNQIYKEYNNIKVLELDVFPKLFEGIFTINAFECWWFFFKRHIFNGFLNLRCLVNIMAVNHLLLKYYPKAIVVSRAELNNVSSINSLFCEKNGVSYINFMHGEMFVSMQKAFVRFSKFYIWDEHYQKILEWGKCLQEQFVVYTPEIFIDVNKKKSKPIYFLTYILTGDEKTGVDANISVVKKTLLQITNYGLKCKIRPHPRWSSVEQLKKIFSKTGIDIEEPGRISVKESIALSEKVAGTYSTVLNEAYHMGKTIVIDDISNPMLITELKEQMYILMFKPHELLSDLVLNLKLR